MIMVEVKTEMSARQQRKAARDEQRKAANPPVGGVRVVPAKEEYRVLKHPTGVAFQPTGSTEWPNDRFTQRRLSDGSIKLAEENAAAPAAAPERQAATPPPPPPPEPRSK
jgi:hypothetical protein